MFGAGLLGKVFGTEKAFVKIVGSVSSAIDKLSYTEEEKVQDAAKQREKARDQVVAFMEATSGQNVARRLIALVIVSVWVICYMTSIGMIVVAVFVDPTLDAEGVVVYNLADQLREGSRMIDTHISDIEMALMFILAFYFGAPHVSAALKTFIESRQKKEEATA